MVGRQTDGSRRKAGRILTSLDSEGPYAWCGEVQRHRYLVRVAERKVAKKYFLGLSEGGNHFRGRGKDVLLCLGR